VALAVSVVGDGEPAGFLGECFLAFEGLELVGVGDLGGDDFEDVLGESAQRDRVVGGGASDQVGLGFAAVLDRQRVRHPCTITAAWSSDTGRRPSRPGPFVVAVQGVREGEAACGVAFGLPGGVGPAATGVGGAGRGAEVEVVGVLGVAQLELGDLVA
jgi:hypothetical protein